MLGANTIAENQNLIVSKPTGAFASQLDLRILALVFKWKILPLFIIKAQLLRGEKVKTFEKRVERLVRKGLLKRVQHLGVIRFLQLTDGGFLRFKQSLDGFKEEGFASEHIWHDFLTMAIQLGAWAWAKPANVEIVSEQEMRRFFLKELPHWLPKIDSHRPDGFTRFKHNGESKVIAFEIEITQKSSERYSPVFQYYNSNQDIDLVIWLVKNRSLKNTLVENIRLVNEQGLGKHAFILLEDFKALFWDAMVELGHEPPLTFVELMSRLCRQDVSPLSKTCRESSFSDFQKIFASV